MSRDTVRVIARLKAKPGREGELRSVAVDLIAPTRSEAGCIRYELLENHVDPAELTFVEEWLNGDALQAHLAKEHVRNALSRWQDLLVGDLDFRRYKLLG